MSKMQSVNTELIPKTRAGDPRIGNEVKDVSLMEDSTAPIILYGCPDDAGIIRNRGREGAKAAPDSIRKHLYKMTAPMHFDWSKTISLFDAGNIEVGKAIDATHAKAFSMAEKYATRKSTLIALGGGHDFAAPNFLGFLAGRKPQKPGLINVDPHLDVRELEENLPHSGTPFRQILESKKLNPKNFVQFGIRSNRNAKSHYEWCKKQKVQIQTWDQIREKTLPPQKQFQKILAQLCKSCDVVGLTIDMDSCESVEGVSAAPVLGWTATELYFFAKLAGLQENIQYFEICEVSPKLDAFERSSRVAAELIFAFLEARASVLKKSGK